MAADGDDPDRRRFSRRAMLLSLAQAAAFGGLATRLYQLQIRDYGHYLPLAEQNRTGVQIIPAMRGRILDRRGAVLADNEQVWRIALVPAQARDVDGVLARLSRILPLGIEKRQQIAARARRQSRNLPIVVASDLSFDEIAEVSVLLPHLPGVRPEVAWRRRYHDGITMGHVVGYVGNADRLAQEDPDPTLRLPGARVGRAGVELAKESQLRGEGGQARAEVDARGHVVRALDRSEARAGKDVRLTIVADLQQRVLSRLAQERRGAVVVLDVTSGEIVTMASCPTFDTSPLAGTVSDAFWRSLAGLDSRPMLNRAVAGLYPPGSTFKLVTALAALHHDAVTPQDRVQCGGTYELAGQTFRCWKHHGHGSVDLNEALKQSCDVYFYEMAHRTGIDALSDMARHLGLGRVYDTDIAAQKSGVIPDPEWKRARVSDRHGGVWLPGETVIAGIGQGYVATTPLQLAVMTARIATGRAIEPYVVLAETEAERAGRAAPPLRLQPRWLEAVRQGMIAVVNDAGGTGANAQLPSGDVRVAGKTGTAQFARRTSEAAQGDLAWEARDHALFVAYAPAESPRYAVAAVVEHGGSGGAVAAPLARDVLQLIFEHDVAGAPPHAEIEHGGGGRG